jgi:hypothetical protein
MPFIRGYSGIYKFWNALLRMENFSVAIFKNAKKLSMELIVKEQGFSEDFKIRLGFVDKDIQFKRLKPSLEIATDEIIDIITKENYDQVILKVFPPEENENLEPSEPATPGIENSDLQDKETEVPAVYSQFNNLTIKRQEEIIDLIKYAIYLKAFILYVPTGDLSVSNNGRLIRRDDKTASAFQWQIEKHDESLEQLFYRHLDRLLRFMFENNLQINQKKYDHRNLTVNSVDIFENHFDINGSRLLYLKLIPALREAENLQIFPRTGKDYLDRIKGEPDSALAFLAQKCIVSYAMVWGINRLNLQLFPKGVLQNESKGSEGYSKKTSDPVQKQGLALIFKRDLDRDLLQLEKEISILQNPPVILQNDDQDLDEPDFGFNCNDKFVSV